MIWDTSFDMLNFATVTGKPLTEYVTICKKKVNPNVSVPRGVRNMLAVFKMIECLDEANDLYLANAGFEVEPGSFDPRAEAYFADMREATCERDITEAQRRASTRCGRCRCAGPRARCAWALWASTSRQPIRPATWIWSASCWRWAWRCTARSP